MIPTIDHLKAVHKHIQNAYPKSVCRGPMDHGKMQLIMEKPFKEIYGCQKYNTIYEQAACLMEGIIRLHPFQDGNKRTALLMTSLFMEANDVYMVVPIDVVRFMIKVADDDTRTEEGIHALICRIAAWLEERSATNTTDFNAKLLQYVKKPLRKAILLLITIVCIPRAMRMFREWFALDTPSAYAQDDLANTIRLILMLAFSNQQAVKAHDSLKSF